MKNTTAIFVFLGLIFVGVIIFAFIYLPKMVEANGIGYKNITLELPVDMTNMRYYDKGVTSFCVNNDNGIGIEVKENAPVLAPVSGVITDIYEGPNRVVIQPETNVLVSVSPLVRLNVIVGDFVNAGDVLGYSEGSDIHFILDNQKNGRYECPFLYLDDSGKNTLLEGLKLTTESTGRICECDVMKY
ncbi:MAG: hypothetical protein UR96_C0002G0019 [candidate division WS6 bacterium GW2011_GWC1_36_11]|uniref:M23ase beta-sheet core domain-containing protein n=3 Tax=Candidatus Dojkabacteria TaxID=74243 RepID=A0A0G0G021_9BACT|nr:MAG: hypothetical protein UR96_C0002G0019 [candidate division WS6 bacterium GW2011_GWC1_36_11]KKQ04650.1 MAG: hypothetical protein US14_C0003G0013 [candidate division WS6 bacterium GW2011_WS6_36_26]KKQ11360.1 MAG: hypothetical protein US24_C0031G0007 [candidate division WS6 bacterium GW2011_GWC2_36_7]KKQ17054.1 MAG: hypothetical protein US29_C0013G0011 [candidate division WS6 bacterium GW2011_GWF1_36_8]HAM96918.1 hypothetical protein [Patescibacteria group bacterium]